MYIKQIMAVAIYQLNLPVVLQEMIQEYVFYSKSESQQRDRKRLLMIHLGQCERWCFTDGIFTTFYYKQMLKTTAFHYLNHWYSINEYSILHAGFCNDCHNYVYANTAISSCIECNCMNAMIVDVD
jgi:hypothetical protein